MRRQQADALWHISPVLSNTRLRGRLLRRTRRDGVEIRCSCSRVPEGDGHTADGLLLAIANALSHDLYYKIIDPTAETAKRLVVARILLVVLGAAGAFVASLKLTSILGAVAWAFDFAMSGLFFPLVLGVWWKRANRQGAVAGMLCGFLAGTWYLYMVRWGGMEPWLGIDHLRFGIIGCSVNLVVMIVVSLATEEPDEATQKMVDEVRIPKGETVLAASH